MVAKWHGRWVEPVFYDRHGLGAKLVEFGGWETPVLCPSGIVKEQLSDREVTGLFDVSHMGRFIFRGAGAVKFLQHALSNNDYFLIIIYYCGFKGRVKI